MIDFSLTTNCSCEHGGGGERSLEGRISLPTLQPLPCLSRSCIGGGGHGLSISVYLVYRVLCCGVMSLSHVLLFIGSLEPLEVPPSSWGANAAFPICIALFAVTFS